METVAPGAPCQLKIYVAPHCFNCDYAVEVAEMIRRSYPQVAVQLIDLTDAQEPTPEAVFATPTYVLNGRIWSLGNPSLQQIEATFGQPTGESDAPL